MSNQWLQLNISNLFYPKVVSLQNVTQLNPIYRQYSLRTPTIKSIENNPIEIFHFTVFTINADDSSTGGKHVAIVSILTN
jgi:hypothetical protein